jgi:hypothetical protein
MLWNLFLDNQDRVIHKWKHYFPIYEKHFERFVNRPLTFLEIGVSKGGSLQMWKKFFGPHATIIGLDIDPQVHFEEDQINIRIGNQSDKKFLAKIVKEFGVPDVVLDDGSHLMADVNSSFDYLYPLLSKDGVYFIEDMHTAYWKEFGGGHRRPGTFIEKSKDLIDELNADHTRGAVSPSEFTSSTSSISFYDSCVVFEKGRYTEKLSYYSSPITKTPHLKT